MATPIGGEFKYLPVYFVEEKNVPFRLDTVLAFFLERTGGRSASIFFLKF